MAEDEEIKGREVTFENMGEFHSFITNRGLNLLSEGIRQFHDSYGAIGVGCGCSKKARIKKAETLYLGVPDSLDEHRRYLLHRVLNEGEELACKKIIFKHNGEQFNELEFEVY